MVPDLEYTGHPGLAWDGEETIRGIHDMSVRGLIKD